MTLPGSIVIAGHTFAIEVVDDSGAALSRNQKPHAIGILDEGRGRIAIRGNGELSDDQTRDTLLHEIIHGVLTLAYLDEESDVFRTGRQSERVVEALATHLLDTLRRNPELVRYLMDGAW
jgi:hypothetical protein